MPAHIEQVREQLGDAREAIHAAHQRGLAPTQVCSRLTAAADAAVQRLWRVALDDLAERESDRLVEGCVLVAHGGYGRRQLAPGSDIDLMVLYSGSAKAVAEKISRRLTTEMFDVGLHLGHSLRSIDDAIQLARTDPIIATSLLESRQIVGSQTLFERFFQAFQATTRRRGAAVCADFIEARRNERAKYGESVFVLEPNIKRSRGGLRDLHLLRWLWFVQTGASDFDRLHDLGAISKYDHRRLIAARDFLLRTRNELHFSAPSAGDSLLRNEQLRIAEALGYRGTESMRPVEQFMRDYFRHASFIWFLASRVSDLTSQRKTVSKAIEPILTRTIERDYRIGFREIAATDIGKAKLARDLSESLRLLTLARDHNKRIAQDTWYHVYRSAPELKVDPGGEAAQMFLEVLAHREGLPQLLRRAHDLTILERLIPAFRDVRCLLQFNQYHKYTVDEHTLRAVDLATTFADREDTLGEVVRELKDPALLHLALLLHDVGKAQPGDHSVTGEQISYETGRLLGLNKDRSKRLALLVRRHLAMSLLAFRRDTNEQAVLNDFAKLVGDTETLAELFVLTCADMGAVGPGVLNDWKIGVLADLFSRTRDRIEHRALRVEERRNAVRMAVWQLLKEEEREQTILKELFASLPEPFLASRSPGAIAGALRRMARVAAETPPPAESIARAGVDAWAGHRAVDETVEVVAAVANGAGRGCFSSMAGALSSKGLAILSAETALLARGVLLLRYTASDPRTASNAAEANRRATAIATSVIHSVDNHETPKLPQVWGAEKERAAAQLSGMPNEVRINTDLSPECTVIEVFTVDRPGLLYELARALHEMDLVIRFARIATSLDQVVDVFYVTDREDNKPTEEPVLENVTTRLMAIIDREG